MAGSCTGHPSACLDVLKILPCLRAEKAQPQAVPSVNLVVRALS